MKLKFLRLFFVIPFFCFLVACSTPKVEQMAGQNSWQGKFSLLTKKDGYTDRNTGTFLLTDTGNQTELLLKGPLGATAASLTENAGGAVLLIPGEDPLRGKNSEEIIARIIGAPLNLQDLISGLTVNNFSEDVLKELERTGWSVAAQKEKDKITRITVSRKETSRLPAVTLIFLIR